MAKVPGPLLSLPSSPKKFTEHFKPIFTHSVPATENQNVLMLPTSMKPSNSNYFQMIPKITHKLLM